MMAYLLLTICCVNFLVATQRIFYGARRLLIYKASAHFYNRAALQQNYHGRIHVSL